MSKTSCSAVDNLYAYKVIKGQIELNDVPEFRKAGVSVRIAEIETELKSADSQNNVRGD